MTTTMRVSSSPVLRYSRWCHKVLRLYWGLKTIKMPEWFKSVKRTQQKTRCVYCGRYWTMAVNKHPHRLPTNGISRCRNIEKEQDSTCFIASLWKLGDDFKKKKSTRSWIMSTTRRWQTLLTRPFRFHLILGIFSEENVWLALIYYEILPNTQPVCIASSFECIHSTFHQNQSYIHTSNRTTRPDHNQLLPQISSETLYSQEIDYLLFSALQLWHLSRISFLKLTARMMEMFVGRAYSVRTVHFIDAQGGYQEEVKHSQCLKAKWDDLGSVRRWQSNGAFFSIRCAARCHAKKNNKT